MGYYAPPITRLLLKMDGDDEYYELLLLVALYLRRRGKANRRRIWVREIFSQRREQGEYHNLLQEMCLVDPNSHFRYLRMSKTRFDDLLGKVGLTCFNYNTLCLCA